MRVFKWKINGKVSRHEGYVQEVGYIMVREAESQARESILRMTYAEVLTLSREGQSVDVEFTVEPVTTEEVTPLRVRMSVYPQVRMDLSSKIPIEDSAGLDHWVTSAKLVLGQDEEETDDE